MDIKVTLSNEQIDQLVYDDLKLQLTCCDPAEEKQLIEALNRVIKLYTAPKEQEQETYMYGQYDMFDFVETQPINRVSYHFGV